MKTSPSFAIPLSVLNCVPNNHKDPKFPSVQSDMTLTIPNLYDYGNDSEMRKNEKVKGKWCRKRKR